MGFFQDISGIFKKSINQRLGQNNKPWESFNVVDVCNGELDLKAEGMHGFLANVNPQDIFDYLNNLAVSNRFESYYSQSPNQNNYFYRTETYTGYNRSSDSDKKGWQQLFREDFMFTSRKSNGFNPDIHTNQPIANAQQCGVFNAFYFYDNLSDPVHKLTTSIYASGEMGVAVMTRFNKHDPILIDANHYQDLTQNSSGCRYLIPKTDNPSDSTIDSKNIEFAFLNHWLPMSDQRVKNAMLLLINQWPLPSHSTVKAYLDLTDLTRTKTNTNTISNPIIISNAP